jgi:hypothetical protein
MTSVATLAVVSAAHSADLPSGKAAPASYVKVCDAYGSGFFVLPGSDTCVKLGGRVRVELGWISTSTIMHPPVIGNGNASTNTHAYTVSTTTGATTPGTMAVTSGSAYDSTGIHTRGILMLESRTPTSMGVVRTSTWIRAVNENGLFSSNYIRNQLVGSNSTSLTLENTFVQWAGFTAGRTKENFTFLPGTGYIFTRRAGFSSGIPQLTYTHVFGGGVTATVAIEDKTGLNSAMAPHSLGGVTGGVDQRGGVIAALPTVGSIPPIVSNLRYDQDWGAAQIMGAVVENEALFSKPAGFGLTTSTPKTVSAWGYALGGGVKINLPMLAKGDEFWIQTGYSKGAFDWMISNNTSAQTSDHGVQLPGLQRIDRNMTVYGIGGNAGSGGAPTDAGVELSQAWNLATMLIHYWSPTVRSVVNVSYLNITPGAKTRNTDWSLGGMSKANTWNISKAVQWMPVKDFELGVEVGYSKLNQQLTGTNGAAPSAYVTPAGVSVGKINPDVWLGRMRVERSF